MPPQGACTSSFGCQQSNCQCSTLTNGNVGCCPTTMPAQPMPTQAPIVAQQSAYDINTFSCKDPICRRMLDGCCASVLVPAAVNLRSIQRTVPASHRRRQWLLSTGSTPAAAASGHRASAATLVKTYNTRNEVNLSCSTVPVGRCACRVVQPNAAHMPAVELRVPTIEHWRHGMLSASATGATAAVSASIW